MVPVVLAMMSTNENGRLPFESFGPSAIPKDRTRTAHIGSKGRKELSLRISIDYFESRSYSSS